MFETFSEPARRVIFWARREAGQSGSEFIEPEHLLKGLLAEDQRDWAKFIPGGPGNAGFGMVREATPPPQPFFSGELAEKLRERMAESAKPGTPKPESMDMPVAESSKRALQTARARAGESEVGLLHLLWALMSDEENSVSTLLKSTGVTVDKIDEAIRRAQ